MPCLVRALADPPRLTFYDDGPRITLACPQSRQARKSKDVHELRRPPSSSSTRGGSLETAVVYQRSLLQENYRWTNCSLTVCMAMGLAFHYFTISVTLLLLHTAHNNTPLDKRQELSSSERSAFTFSQKRPSLNERTRCKHSRHAPSCRRAESCQRLLQALALIFWALSKGQAWSKATLRPLSRSRRKRESLLRESRPSGA
jgi:hypothetical protein